jgi:hypothetical protein
MNSFQTFGNDSNFKISFMEYYKCELNVGKLPILYHRIFLLSFQYLNRKDYSLEHYNIKYFLFFLKGGGRTGSKTDIYIYI